MSMICEKCGKAVSASEGEYVYFQGKIMFACKACAEKLNDEIKCARKVCAAIDGKKNQAESIIKNKDAYEKFLKNIDTTIKKIPDIGNLLSDIPLLIDLVKSYIANEYLEIPYNTIIAVVAALLYVISPIDMLPDVIPGVGYEDDAMVVAFCKKQFYKDLANFKAWYGKNGFCSFNCESLSGK